MEKRMPLAFAFVIFYVERGRWKIPEDVIIWIIRRPFHWDSGNHIYQAIPERPIDYRSMPQKAKAQTHFDFYISQKNAPKLIQRKKFCSAFLFQTDPWKTVETQRIRENTKYSSGKTLTKQIYVEIQRMLVRQETHNMF